MKVFGIDIITGSIRSRTRRPMYALIILDQGKTKCETEVSHYRLIRMLMDEEPDVLAVDSIQEIAENQHELYTFMQMLPPMTKLVQVTGGEKRETLGKIAAKYNIRFNRFDPSAEARVIAKVASLGGGAEVIAFENSCEVIVSRHRSIGKGGWSQNRYIRKIHGAVLQRARDIDCDLISAGLRYDKKESKAFGGASRVTFHVYAPRTVLPIHAYRGADVQVRISSKRLDRIYFRPLTERQKYLIIGIDPGTTIAYAAIDLDGNLVYTNSSRQASMGNSIEALSRLGKPLILASDVQQMPYSVEKIRRAFNAIGYTPRQDRSVEEKQELTGGYTYRNVHERDALAAALDAYRHYHNKLQNITKRVPPGYELDEVRAGVIRGLSLEKILGERDITAVEQPSGIPITTSEGKKDERITNLEVQVKRLKKFTEELQVDQKEKDREIFHLQQRIYRERSTRGQELKRDLEVAKRDVIIQNLKRQLRHVEQRNRSLNKRLNRIRQHAISEGQPDIIPLKVLSALTKEGIRNLSIDLGLQPGDNVYVPKTDGWGRTIIKELADSGIQAIIVGISPQSVIDPFLMKMAKEYHVPLINSSFIDVVIRGKTGVASRHKFDQAMKKWEMGIKEEEKQRKTKMLEHIFKEYQWEREKEAHRGG